MCVVSFVMDHYQDKWSPKVAPLQPIQPPYIPFPVPTPVPAAPLISQEELDEFRRLLERAREYDRKMSQPDCGEDSKRKAVKELAKALGVEITFL